MFTILLSIQLSLSIVLLSINNICLILAKLVHMCQIQVTKLCQDIIMSIMGATGRMFSFRMSTRRGLCESMTSIPFMNGGIEKIIIYMVREMRCEVLLPKLFKIHYKLLLIVDRLLIICSCAATLVYYGCAESKW